MRLAVVGGGGFRVPLVYRALLAGRAGAPRVSELRLTDTDPARLDVVARVLAGMGAGRADAPRVVAAPSLAAALQGADAVFAAVRAGGAAGRVRDERTALGLGLLGQETVGAGGLSYALRSVPAALELAHAVAEHAPRAWVVDFTNPAGIVTEAMQQVLGERVIGICDSPVALARRAARALGLDPSAVQPDYVGLNHAGWLRALVADGVDHLPRLLADDAALATFEEGRLFGGELLRALGALPNEYLWYHYRRAAALGSVDAQERTRGEVVRAQQEEFYAAAAGAAPEQALGAWLRALGAREETYFAEGRSGAARDAADVADEGYEGVALDLLGALSGAGARRLVLDVRNGTTLPALPADGVVEVVCEVDEHGARPLPAAPLTLHQTGLLAALKASERAVLAAATTPPGSAQDAELLRAFTYAPLIADVDRARDLLRGYGLGGDGPV
ncbi:6-phospho-beta-glucosidase [Motilibacter rhizosphaerae]|uniref:6-phospho-beta-glucosidase n=1 Tax=Motilibacter rhizosphaerae TaxID=598652 RepID=A0A4Q7NG14_9ACTN|nr:6-phospho-beta-glucosidase [Motilibacter rhizosphaerae]RZS82755.1 6-phospho-beta-glucosidase [Motilibacter rhizosphaerae]